MFKKAVDSVTIERTPWTSHVVSGVCLLARVLIVQELIGHLNTRMHQQICK